MSKTLTRRDADRMIRQAHAVLGRILDEPGYPRDWSNLELNVIASAADGLVISHKAAALGRETREEVASA